MKAPRRLGLVLAYVGLALACRITNSNETSIGGSTTLSPTSPTPTPSPTPTSGTSSTSRTPDPAPGQVLPFPPYAASVAATVPTTGVVNNCTTYAYLDAVVDALRTRDTRWGYVCKSACATVAFDAITYHATAGAEVAGAAGNYVVDIVKNSCTTPEAQFLFLGYDASAQWSGRGRF